MLTAETAGWVERHLSEIEDRFSPHSRDATVRTLEELKKKRASELFG